MSRGAVAALVLCATLLAGCVVPDTTTKKIPEYQEYDQASAQSVAAFSKFKSTADVYIGALEKEHVRLSHELTATQGTLEETKGILQATKKDLAEEQATRRKTEKQLETSEDKNKQLVKQNGSLRKERDQLQTSVRGLEQKLGGANQELANSRKSLIDCLGRNQALTKKHADMSSQLLEAQRTKA
ncbi:MAG: hypothetical protein ACE5NA_07745, partial [Nitrospiraceae bacterium]